MSTATIARDEVVAKIALGIESALLDWEEGRATSPDQRDYVGIATETFTQLFTGYVPTDREEDIADVIFERESVGDWGSPREIAEYLYDELNLGIPPA